MNVSTAIVWLKAASAVLLVAFGAMFALAAFPLAAAPALFFVDMLFCRVISVLTTALFHGGV